MKPLKPFKIQKKKWSFVKQQQKQKSSNKNSQTNKDINGKVEHALNVQEEHLTNYQNNDRRVRGTPSIVRPGIRSTPHPHRIAEGSSRNKINSRVPNLGFTLSNLSLNVEEDLKLDGTNFRT
uniref:Uncharacterized protein n=1 Tax=Glossina austeni TaxID=7395 RepID=A0A1A9VWC1_GLOAU